MRQANALSGFTFCNDDSRIMIAYGKKRRSGLMSCVTVSRLNPGHSQKCIGLAYVKCRLDDPSHLLLDADVEELEECIESYCLLLPFLNKGEFTDQYAVIYDDWDVGDKDFKKVLPSLCQQLFETDVMRPN